MNAYYFKAEAMGVNILYGAEVNDLNIKNGQFESAEVLIGQVPRTVKARSIVVASGGFQADISWLKKYWGDAADNFIIRGTPYDRGKMLKVLLDNGAKQIGDPRQCHAVAIDARAPKFDGGIITRLDCVPFGIVVNKYAQRFYDEGEDFWPKRYAIWGRLVAAQPDQIAYSIIDFKSINLFMPSLFPPIEADSIHNLAEKLDLDPVMLAETVETYNAAVRPGKFISSELDDCITDGLAPQKSHWARALDTPPFYGYPLRPGITFTYLSVTINKSAQVVMEDEKPLKNVFAAGEIISGNILGQGYLAGFGMTIGTVFGRIAGQLYLKLRMDPLSASLKTFGLDVGFIISLFLTSLTGLLLLIFRSTPLMGILLIIHMGVVAGLFITMPYGKFVQGVYRYAVLVRNAIEQSQDKA